MLDLTDGDVLEVTIVSRANRNGRLDHLKYNGFEAEVRKDGEPIDVSNATFVWHLYDSAGNTVTATFDTAYNHFGIPANTLSENNYYVVDVTVTHDTYSGQAMIEYSTDVQTTYRIEIEPSTGEALSTEFHIAATTQDFDKDLTMFTFGYYKDGVKVPLTR